MKKILYPLLLSLFLLLPAPTQAQYADRATWHSYDANGEVKTHLYFFWSASCPHCRRAKPYIKSLPNALPFIDLHMVQLNTVENRQLFSQVASQAGEEPRAVPAFAFCEQIIFGYDGEMSTGADLIDALKACHGQALNRHKAYVEQEAQTVAAAEKAVTQAETTTAEAAMPASPKITIPFYGTLETGDLSLPLMTLVLAGLDAFNPCAFFVLLFLLSLMVNAHSRARMFLVGGVFVLISGIIYFMFMAAWLNLFKWIGDARIVTVSAASLALLAGGLNVKDFFFIGKGPSLSIAEEKKPGLFKRMNALISEQKMTTVLIGTVVLAVIVNAYELLCTAGFPMVFTRILTLRDITGTDHYLYLLFYNIVYVLPLFAIVTLFALTLGRRKLSEKEGRFLKLLSGTMMTLLGGTLLISPHLLENLVAAVALLGGAIGLSALIAIIDKLVRKK